MPIFRKSVVEHSKAIFAIKADTKEQADKAFEEFFDGENNRYDEYRAHMNAVCTEDVTDLSTFDNEEEYNRSVVCMHDFWIEAENPEKPEPVYDLYFIFDENPLHIVRKVWQGINTDKVTEIMKEYNKKYKLFPNTGVSYHCWKDAEVRGAKIFAYRLAKREEKEEANG